VALRGSLATAQLSCYTVGLPTDRQTDGQNCYSNIALCRASHADAPRFDMSVRTYMKLISPQLAANIQHTEQNNTNQKTEEYTE